MPEQGSTKERAGQKRGGGFSRFALQYLVSPILVAAIGFYFNMRLQDAKAELERSRQQLDRIAVAHEIIQNALSSDYEQCFITLRLVEVVLEPELAAQVIEGVTDYLSRRAGSELAQGRPEEAVAIVKAAQSTGGEAGRKVEESILKATAVPQAPERLSKAQKAEEYTSEGFRCLLSGRYEEALGLFRKAEETYPGYGSAAEIMETLSRRFQEMTDPDAERRVVDEIIEKFSWQTQRDFSQEMLQRRPR